MRAKMIKLLNLILASSLVVGCIYFGEGQTLHAEASTIAEVQDQIKDTQDKIAGFEDQIDSLSDEQDLVYEQIDDLQSEIINVMTSISLLEDQIAQKEVDIANTQAEYDAAVAKQAEQEESMALHIQLLYEKGTSSILQMLLTSTSFSDLLNKFEYAESFYRYENQILDEYKANKEYIHQVWNQLEEDKASLETDKADLEEHKAYCDGLMTELKQKAADYDSRIASVQKSVKNAKKELQAEQKKLQQLQEEEARKQQVNANINATYAKTSYTDIIDAATGSELGKKIAKYGCQYIGNKYVYGGTSLTNGTDCSGFTYRIYKDFGYDIPRTSYEQRSTGTAVSYENAQPGDLICYDGHVGLYIGGGYIVHASNARTGIKVSKATYRKILAVRRIIK